MLDEPIIIVGSLRSGTTVFRLMLDHHPEIQIIGEFEEAVEFLDDSGWPDLYDYLHWLKTHRIFLGKNLQISSFSEYPELVRNMLQQASSGTKKRFVGAVIHSRFHRCSDIWPNARYIHILRDPRDVARSCVRMGWVGNAYYGAGYWVNAEKRWDKLVKIITPKNWVELRYEGLITDPVPVLTRVCEFIGVPFDREMLLYDRDTTYSPPDSALVEQWRRKLSEREIQQVEHRCGSLLLARGYAESGVEKRSPKSFERVRLYAEHRLKRARASVNQYGLKLWLSSRFTKYLGSYNANHRVKLRMNDIVNKSLK